MEEARFSFNLKFQVSGMEAQFTCRAGEEQQLGSFRETIRAAVSMVQSLGASPRPGNGSAGNGKKKPESGGKHNSHSLLCPVCGKADALRLIEFTPKGFERSISKYKCERCNKWLPGEVQPAVSQAVKDIEELWPA